MTPSIKNDGKTQHENIADGRSIVRSFDILDKLEHTCRLSWDFKIYGKKRKTFRRSLPRMVVRWLVTDGQRKRCALSHPPHDQRRQTDWLLHLTSSPSLRCLSASHSWMVCVKPPEKWCPNGCQTGFVFYVFWLLFRHVSYSNTGPSASDVLQSTSLTWWLKRRELLL